MTDKEKGERLRQDILYWLKEGLNGTEVQRYLGITRAVYYYHRKILKAEGHSFRDLRYKS